jgi:hypothetical protein
LGCEDSGAAVEGSRHQGLGTKVGPRKCQCIVLEQSVEDDLIHSHSKTDRTDRMDHPSALCRDYFYADHWLFAKQASFSGIPRLPHSSGQRHRDAWAFRQWGSESTVSVEGLFPFAAKPVPSLMEILGDGARLRFSRTLAALRTRRSDSPTAAMTKNCHSQNPRAALGLVKFM